MMRRTPYAGAVFPSQEAELLQLSGDTHQKDLSVIHQSKCGKDGDWYAHSGAGNLHARLCAVRRDLVGRKFWNLLFIFTMYFGGGLVPYYMVLKGIHMLNTFWVFIFPLMMSVYNMILVRSYVESMPESLFEAAKIDGATDLTVFFRLVLPLSKPILMTIGLFVAVNQWNSWFDAYLYTSAQSLKPMQSVLVEILNQYQTGGSVSQQMSNAKSGMTVTPDSIRMAATMVATIPIIMVYPFIQKYFVKGIMLGAVKA